MIFLINPIFAYLAVMITDFKGRKIGYNFMIIGFLVLIICGLINNLFFVLMSVFMVYIAIDISN